MNCTYICSFEVLLLLVQSSLNNVSPGEESLLETSEGLVLDLHGDVVVEHLAIDLDAELLERRRQVVSLLGGLVVILILLLPLLHLVTSLHEDGLLKDALEDVLLIVLLSLLIDGGLRLIAVADLLVHGSLLVLDLVMTLHLNRVDLLQDLLLLVLLCVLVIDVVQLGLSNVLVPVPLLFTGGDLSLFVVVVDVHLLKVQVELGLLHLSGSWHVRIKVELLCHLLQLDRLFVVVLVHAQVSVLRTILGVEYATSVHESVRTILVLFNDLVLVDSKEFFSHDESILLSVMVEEDLSGLTIILHLLLPVEVRLTALVVLNQLEEVGEATSHYQLVLPAAVVRTNLLRY